MRNAPLLLLALQIGCSAESSVGGDYAADAEGEGDTGSPGAGTLTAGAWDDNQNYDLFEDYRDGLQGLEGMPGFDPAAQDAANAAPAAGPREHLDIALVLDTTGSMGDEMRYLQAEFDALTARIDEAHPGAEQRWALVVYRDQGDAYVTKKKDFTSDLAAFRARLGSEDVGGGGDYPEAPDRGLKVAMDLDWRTGDDARLLFWVADAPHHPANRGRLVEAVEDAVDADVRIYPVAASGTDDLTEYSMRAAAQLTRGRYLFLTDDSGVGGEHKEPDVPCYFVTRLDDAILRMVDIELTGAYREPSAEELIRTGGDPEDRRCTLADEQVAIAF